MSTDSTAPTPAPMAVPEGGWRDGDALVIWARRDGATQAEAVTFRRSSGRWPNAADDAWATGVVSSGRAVYVHALRPEPVVAPLPSEAVKAAVEAVLLSVRVPATGEGRLYCDDDGKWDLWDADDADMHMVRDAVVAALPDLSRRLVPEDDEDTVRVAALNLIEVYDDTAPDWYPAAIDDLREALGGAR